MNVTQNSALGGQALTAVKEGEVSREFSKMRQHSKELAHLSTELITRLASIISPNETPKNPQEQTDYQPSTPLASNMKDINHELETAIKSLSFILGGLEL